MTIETSYTHARAHLAALCDQAVDDRDVIIIRRRGARDVALLAAEELESLMETAHLLRSPKNAQRLLTALARARERTVAPQSIEEVKREVGLAGSDRSETSEA